MLRLRFYILLTCLFMLNEGHLHGMSRVPILRTDSLKANKEGFALHHFSWRFHIADGSDYSNPAIADNTWAVTATTFGRDGQPKGWNGNGWFRLWLKADENLIGMALAVRISQTGAAEIYLDGKKIGETGKIGKTKMETRSARAPFSVYPFIISDHRQHLLVVRYVNEQPPFPEYVGFRLWAGTYEQLATRAIDGLKTNSFLLTSIGAQLALVLLHLALFAFYPKKRLNLYYSLFVFSTAAVLYLRYLTVGTSDPYLQRITADLFEAGIILVAFLAGIVLYGVSYDHMPRRRILISAVLGFLTLMDYFQQYRNATGATTFWLEIIYFLLVMADGLFALVRAVKRRKPRVWLIGAGMLSVTLFYIVVGSDLFSLMKGNNELIAKWMSIGLLAIPLSFSVYLALDFADVNRSLSARLREVEELSEVNLAQETEKNRILAGQADQLEKTVAARTLEVRSQAQKLQEMDALKSRFIVNLTHEFRTPLSLIMGPAGLLAEKAGTNADRKQGELIRENAQQLLLLINQLLDLSKLEEGKMEIVNAETDVLATVTDVLKPFANISAQKGVTIEFRSQSRKLNAIIDASKLTMIIRNLVSNAVKFSLNGGEIIITVTVEENFNTPEMIFNIADQGIGIQPHKLPYVFDRFYQTDASDTRANEGSGIGLALTRELVELLGGSIDIESTENIGTTLRVKLPVTGVRMVTGEKLFSLSGSSAHEYEEQSSDITDEKPWLLIIEDHEQLRQFISVTLGTKFRLLTAANGEEGLRIAGTNIPDLVITDLMMPVMDGYELCHKIKQQELTSHIPVLMLTAKSAADSRTKGWEAGADAYLSKPFEPAELLAIVEGLIKTRRQLHERFHREEAWKPATSLLPPQELSFMEKVRNIIEAQLDNELFGVDMLCDLIKLSRTQLHRKLKNTIGHPPGDLIRIVRLQQALTLLKAGGTTVADVAYKVGFNSPASFSTSFSNYFGYAPSEVKK
jgi:signal transduction histidine kinase/CheY-like chemotaxis protein